MYDTSVNTAMSVSIDQMKICLMTIFSFRNDSPMIPGPLHNGATKKIENTAKGADQRSARHVRCWLLHCKIPSLEENEEKVTQVAETVQHKT